MGYANMQRIFSALARIHLCHSDGTVVPMRWQCCASSMAKLCHRSGTNLSLHTTASFTASSLGKKLNRLFLCLFELTKTLDL